MPCGVSQLDTSACHIWCHSWSSSKRKETWKCGEQTDGRTIIIRININKMRVCDLDTSAWQNVDFFPQYQNTSSRTVGTTDEHIKWKQYPSASMSVEDKSSGYISIPNFMPFPQVICHQTCRNLKKVVNEWTDGQAKGQTSGWMIFLCPPQFDTGQKCGQKWKFRNVKKITLCNAVTLIFDPRPWKN